MRGLSSVFALVVIGAALHSAPTVAMADEPATLKILIDIPSHGWDGKMVNPKTLRNTYPDREQFRVVIENISAKPVFLAEGNSMIDGLSFEIITDDGRKTVSHRLLMTQSKYVVGELAIPPGLATVQDIYYGRDWEAFPFPDRTVRTRKITLRAMLSMPVLSKEEAESAYLKGHWMGTAASEPCSVILDSL
jgi:hypothetical protein